MVWQRPRRWAEQSEFRHQPVVDDSAAAASTAAGWNDLFRAVPLDGNCFAVRWQVLASKPRSHCDDIRYVKTDLPGVIQTKLGLREERRRHHAIPPNAQHVVTAANVLVFEEVQASAASLDPGERLTVLCEGLIMYLSKAQTEVLARNIHRLLGGLAGYCWITPYFTFRSEPANLSPDRVRLREAITGITQTQFDASAFDDEQDHRIPGPLGIPRPSSQSGR